MKKRINPLSRRPRQQRLVLAVRGAAGSGKSHFASTLADAGMGRLCFFDTERKARLIPGSDGTTFDALEIEHPDELPEFIDWALDGEGREQNYGCYALDSWAMYFGRKHRATVQAVRDRTGDPLAQPDAEALANDQVILQEVLRRLCIDSGACVVITDQIAAKGKEEREENELGKVLPMTASGLEYFVDVMVELNVQMDGFEPVRIARVIKSNSADFPVGMEIVNPTFKDFLDRVGTGLAPQAVAEFIEEPAPHAGDGLAEPAATLDTLFAWAEELGIERPNLLLAARHYCGVETFAHLNTEQIHTLMDRMKARYRDPTLPAINEAA